MLPSAFRSDYIRSALSFFVLKRILSENRFTLFGMRYMWSHTIIDANCILSSFDPYKGKPILLKRL
ncbi:hypothetical protein CQ059_16000 [Brucella pseudogrignonensis]|nr:hypothetical protein CQ059_16000 [Brucella pseudogrignonensis]PRA40519.1 hypothetical protein CQ063_13155 [Brucella pseudogrignonensis]PRA69115.1 hypothetical protein CQ055_13045 [Brucella pseudogrignonensis]